MEFNFNKLFGNKDVDDTKTSKLKTAAYVAAGIASLGLVAEDSHAQNVDSLKDSAKFTVPVIESLETPRNYVVGKDSLPNSIDTNSAAMDTLKFKIYEGEFDYKTLIKLYPSLQYPNAWKANFPGIPFPGEKPKE